MTDLLFSLGIATLVRATALAAAVALVLTLFRIRSSSTRHAAWVAVLVTMLLLPVLTRVVPAIRVSVPDRALPFELAPPVRQIDTPLSELPASITSGKGGAEAPPVAAPRLPLPDEPISPAAPVRWDVVGLAVYLTGLAFFLVRYVIGLTQLARIRHHSRPVLAVGQPAFESVFIATPATVGLLAPRVILPATWRDWSSDTLTAVLAHERAHAARRDPLIAALARLNCAVFWFHPLAWWLERRLGTLAEHACDDAALMHVPARSYAETLLDIASTVRRNHGRLAWQAVGVDGDGQLGRRIDRVLSGTSRPETSRARRVLFAASCAIAIVAAVACQQKVEPLREDPVVAAKMKENLDRNKAYRADREMTLEQASALEKTLEQNPEDMATRGRLLNFYTWTGKNTQPWNDNVAARRRHALWLVEHHPDSPLVGRAVVTKETDPVGYSELRKRWLAATAPADADEKVLTNAAWFFALPEGHPARRAGQQELQLAEALLIRARKSPRAPDTPPSTGRLAELYVSALAPRPGTAQDAAQAAWAKKRLDESTDAAVLFEAGRRLFFVSQARELGQGYIERASRMDPAVAQRAKDWFRMQQLARDPDFAFSAAPRSEWPGILAKSTGVVKLRQLAAIADREYSMAEYYEWRARQPVASESASPNITEDKRLAAEAFAHAGEYARAAIELAPSLSGAGVGEAAFSAHHTLGLWLLHDGNRRGAVEQMMAAARLPVPAEEPFGVSGLWAWGHEYKLVFYLLKNGERQTVIDYFERASQGRSEAHRKVMLAAAAAIRDGRMPEHYQYLVAGGSL